MGGADDDIPVEIAVFRYQFTQQRDGVQVDDYLAGAQAAQLIQQVDRIGAAQHNLCSRLEADPEGALG